MEVCPVHWGVCSVASASAVGGRAGVVAGDVSFAAQPTGRGFGKAHYGQPSESAVVAALSAWAKEQLFGQAESAVTDE